MRIHVRHVIAAGYCSRGLVSKLKAKGLKNEQIREALANGMDEEDVRAMNDAQMDKVVQTAHDLEGR